jgi:hypothetical protein
LKNDIASGNRTPILPTYRNPSSQCKAEAMMEDAAHIGHKLRFWAYINVLPFSGSRVKKEIPPENLIPSQGSIHSDRKVGMHGGL